MVDIATITSSMILNKSVDFIWNKIINSDNPEEMWKEAAKKCAIQAESSYKQNYANPSNSNNSSNLNREALQRELNQIGQFAQELSIRGDINDFDEDIVELLQDFAEICSNSPEPKLHLHGAMSEFGENLNEIIEEIKSKTK